MTANSNFGTITSFTRHAHDLYSSIKYFRNFLFHDTFDEFWMATAYKDVNTFRVVFNFININIDDVVWLKAFPRNLVLAWQLSFERSKIHINETLVKTFNCSLHDFTFMLLIVIISNFTHLLAHLFHNGLFGRLRCDTAKFIDWLFKTNLVTKLVGRADSKGIFQANFQTTIKDFIYNFTNSINLKITCFFIEFNYSWFWLTITTLVGWLKRFNHSIDDIFLVNVFFFFQDTEGF